RCRRADLLRPAHPVPGAAAGPPVAAPGGPPGYRPLGKRQPRRRPGGAVRAHRVPGRTTGRWTMSTALAAPPAGTYYDTALKTRAIRLLPADFVVTDEPVALVTLLGRSEEHTSELQSRENLVCRLLLEKKKNN